jgi:hypothetical protein
MSITSSAFLTNVNYHLGSLTNVNYLFGLPDKVPEAQLIQGQQHVIRRYRLLLLLIAHLQHKKYSKEEF